jgi:DNA-binding protein
MTEEEPKGTEEAKQARPIKSKADDTVVFIGQKPVMSYVLACLTLLNSGTNKVVVKARGRAIPRAVDTIEVLRRSFAQGLQLEGIALGTEEVDRTGGQKSRVSAIEIAVIKS